MLVSVVVTTHRSHHALDRVLLGYHQQSTKPHQVIVTEDGEDPDTFEVVAKWRNEFDSIELLHVRQVFEGYRRAKILNQAIIQSEGDYIIVTDGDCLPHKHFVRDHARLAEDGYWVQGCRAHLTEPASTDMTWDGIAQGGWRLWLSGKVERGYNGIRWPIPLVWRQKRSFRERSLGSNMGFWKKDLLQVNGFNEDFIGWGPDDREIALRLYNSGLRKKYTLGRAIQFHLYHPPASKHRREANLSILREQKRLQANRCSNGIQKDG